MWKIQNPADASVVSMCPESAPCIRSFHRLSVTRAGIVERVRFLRALVPVHAAEYIPVERLCGDSMKRDRFDYLLFTIGQHAPDDGLRLLDKTTDDLVRQILCDGLVFGGWTSAAQRMAQDRSLGRDGKRIASGRRVKLRPLRDGAGHILAQDMDSVGGMMPMRRPFGHDE